MDTMFWLERDAPRLEELARTRMLIRILVYFKPPDWPVARWRRVTQINLLTYVCEDLFELVCVSDEVGGVLRLGTEKFIFHNRGDASGALCLRLAELDPDFWIYEEEFVARAKDYEGNFSAVLPTNFHLMLHYARLHTLLVETRGSAAHDTPEGMATRTFLRRFEAFFKERIKEWERVLG